jgi:hypothetical protein
MKRSYFICTLLTYVLQYIYINFIYNIVFFNILFRYIIFTYRNKNSLLIICIIFSGFLGPHEHLQVFECPVALWSVISEDRLSSQHQGGYVLSTARKSTKWNQIQPNKMWEEQSNATLPSVLQGMQGGRQPLAQCWIWNTLFRQWSYGGPHKSQCGFVIIPRSPVAP